MVEGRLGRRSRRTRCSKGTRLIVLAVTVLSIALLGAQPAAAETGPSIQALRTGESFAKFAQESQAPPSRALKSHRRGTALVGGYANYRDVNVALQYFNRSTRRFVNWKFTTSNYYGYYGFRVPAGYTYRFFAWFRVNQSHNWGGDLGWVPCTRTYAGNSRHQKAWRGWRFSNMNINLVLIGGC